MRIRLSAVCTACCLSLMPGLAAAQSALDELEQQLRGGQPLPQPGYAGLILDEDANPGILVREVVPGGPAEVAGLQAGDRIVMLDGRPVKSLADLIDRMQTRTAGDEVHCDLIRGETVLEAALTLGERPPPGARRFAEFGPIPAAAPPAARGDWAPGGDWGLRVEALNAQTQQATGVPVTRGVLVLEVAADSPAAAAGLSDGAVIVAADGQRVASPEELAGVVAAADDGQVEVSYYVGEELRETTVELAVPGAALEAQHDVAAPAVPDLQRRVELLEQRLDRIERLLERLLAPPPGER